MKAINLRVNYLKEPLGLQNRPVFFWNCEGGVSQSAYQITAYRNDELLFDSGKVGSSRMTHIPYEGKTLKRRDHIVWNVVLWDEKDEKGETSSSSFEMGLLNKEDFFGKWISGNYRPKKNTAYPVDCFRKMFVLKGTVAKARLYASARGLYDVTINGKRIEDFILAPGITDYRKRIQYQVYDVTEYLKQDNELELRLADGWYRGTSAVYGVRNVYGDQTSVYAQLEVSYDDGHSECICTDSSFEWSNDGPLREADLRDGEVYDAQRKLSYNGKALEVKTPEALLLASDNVYVREHEVFQAELLENNVLKFPQNIAGYLRFKIKGNAGQKLKMVLGEVLDENGNVDLNGVQETRPKNGWTQPKLIKKLLTGKVDGEIDKTPHQEIAFICSGEEDEYKTSFAVFGFCYVQVFGDVTIDPNDFQAIAVYSDMEDTGHFECSNKDINRLMHNTLWSMKGNFLDIPTDCPTRERLGWTGDAQIFFNTGAYLMDTSAFFQKWLRDMEDNQYKNGLISGVLPYEGVEMMYKQTGSAVGWADALYLIPYRYYKMYGDIELLNRFWPMIRKYSEYLLNHLGRASRKDNAKDPYAAYTYEKGIHLGEWLEPEEFRDKVYGAKGRYPEECTAYLYLALTTIAEIADRMGESEYARKLENVAEKAKEAYNVNYANFDTLRQAKLVRPLAFGLYDGVRKKLAQEKLKKAIEDYRYRIGTGFLSTPFLLPVLTEAGYKDLAYKVLLNEDRPGWLYEVRQGATTVWEDWEGKLSQNHYSPGAVCEWLFNTVGGINIEKENRFLIQPVPGGALDYAKTSYRSLYGAVSCEWKRNKDRIIYKVVIPSNCEADICLEGQNAIHVKTGEYIYEI